MIEEKEAQTKTFYPVEDIEYISGYDYITVTAARTTPWENPTNAETLREAAGTVKRGFRESLGNQYRFVNHSLRQLQSFPSTTFENHIVQRLHIVFEQGYTFEDMARINEYSENLNAKTIYIKDVEALISFLNERKEKKRLIKALVFYAHGLVSTLTFHYSGDRVSEGLFKKDHVSKVPEKIFDYDALVTSYGCRNGISMDGKHFPNGEAGQKESLAQKMADEWLVKVKAYEMRSKYGNSYGTPKERADAQNYGLVIDDYEKKMRWYDELIAEGHAAIKPEKPPNYDKNKSQYDELKARDKNAKSGGGPIAPNGAWHDVGTGDTPTGLKQGLQTYTPEEWQCGK